MGYTHGIQWTDELIKEEIFKVMESLNLNRMPSEPEIKNTLKNSGLACAISRRGGFRKWADKLNLSQSHCETRTGFNAEIKIKEILSNNGYEVEKMSIKHPYDLLVDKNIKIDVKAANKYVNGEGHSYYSFNLEKRNPTCDIYILLCIDTERIFIIPSKFLHQTQISMSDNSKYSIYENRWDYIEQYSNFYKTVI